MDGGRSSWGSSWAGMPGSTVGLELELLESPQLISRQVTKTTVSSDIKVRMCVLLLKAIK
jgi:hypothetical protein